MNIEGKRRIPPPTILLNNPDLWNRFISGKFARWKQGFFSVAGYYCPSEKRSSVPGPLWAPDFRRPGKDTGPQAPRYGGSDFHAPGPAPPYPGRRKGISLADISIIGRQTLAFAFIIGLMAGFTEEIGRNGFALPCLRIHFGVPVVGLFPGLFRDRVWHATPRLPGGYHRLRPSLSGA